MQSLCLLHWITSCMHDVINGVDKGVVATVKCVTLKNEQAEFNPGLIHCSLFIC